MVEKILKEAKEPLSRYEIIKRTGNKIMRQTLNTIIEYMDEHGLVLDGGRKGIIWTYTPKKELDRKIKQGLKV